MSEPISYPLQFGMYRDGDNNLDEIQAFLLDEAKSVTKQNSSIAINVLDTTRRVHGFPSSGPLHSEEYSFVNGKKVDAESGPAQDMSERATLANFVAHTLDEAEKHNAKSTWLDLIDHGGGDAGAFQTDCSGGDMMTEDGIASAIVDGMQAHANAHPEDAKRRVDGVVMNACLMATLGMESALSHAGVQYLAASPETMIAPGVPTSIAQDIATFSGNAKALGQAMVDRVMNTQFCAGNDCFTPAAAFDVFHLDAKKIASMEHAVANFNTLAAASAKDADTRSAMKSDVRKIDGMTRGQEAGLPWHADRPAEAVYQGIASDARLPDTLRAAAALANKAVAATVLAHGEAQSYAPFGGASYSDADGPTAHFPLSRRQIDPWAPSVSESKTAFALRVHQDELTKALALA